jgi:hypothetical protein
MAGSDRESTQDQVIPEHGGPEAAPAGDGVAERSPPPRRVAKRLDWRIEAAAASVDAWASLVAGLAEELDRVHAASLEAAAQGSAAAEIAERAAAAAAGAQLLAAERAQRVDRAEERVSDLAGRVEDALGRLEAGEQATVRRAERASEDERSLRSFEERADRVVRLLREAEQAACDTLDRHRRRRGP